MRGRLRALAALDPLTMAQQLERMDGLFARSAAAAGRHAWAWAWREARVGFGFHADRMRAASCDAKTEEQPCLEPLGPEEEPAVRTFLLSMVGRGCWDALERWLQGAAGRSLGGSFYRHLGRAPSQLRDQAGSSGYRRIWRHLADGGVDAYLPALERVALRVSAVSSGRGSKQALHRALLPEWEPAHLELPAHHVAGFIRSCQRFISCGDASLEGVST